MTITGRGKPSESSLSNAALRFQESAIRRTGILGAAVPGLISFAAGYPAPEMFPWDDLQSIASDPLAKHDGNTLQYGATRGYRPLIEHLLAHGLKDRGISAAFEDVVITTGSQQGLDLAGRVLIDPGDVVIVELPAYSGAIAAFHNLQADRAGVPQDAEGIDLAALEAVLSRLGREGRRAKFIYVTPNFQNPAGLLMSATRRRDLLAAARRHDLIILEDDPYGSLQWPRFWVPSNNRSCSRFMASKTRPTAGPSSARSSVDSNVRSRPGRCKRRSAVLKAEACYRPRLGKAARSGPAGRAATTGSKRRGVAR